MMAQELGQTRLCVKGLPKHVKEDRLHEHFAQKGLVTDVKIMRTKEGKSRLFGFVGFSSAKEAKDALNYFNGTFLDTSKIAVELARPVGDNALPRPWSKYSKGSSLYDKLHSEPAGKDRQPTDSASSHKKRKHSELAVVPHVVVQKSNNKHTTQRDTDHELQEFLRTATHRGSTAAQRVWENDLALSDSQSAVLPISIKKQKLEGGGVMQVETKAVPNRKPGGVGQLVRKTHLRFLDEEENATDVDEVERAQDSGTELHIVSELAEAAVGSGDETDPTLTEGHPGPVTSPTPDALQEAGSTGRLFVRNLAYSTTEEDLLRIFRQYGQIGEVHIVVDKETKQSKGMAFLRYLAPQDATKALLALDHTTIHGRLIHIMPALPAPDSSSLIAPALERPGRSFQERRKKEQKATAGERDHNPLLLQHDAVLAAASAGLGIAKGDIVSPEVDNAAARLAIAEARLIDQTKSFFQQEGIRFELLDKTEGARSTSERSQTVLIIKQLPAQTSSAELRGIFEKYGELSRLVLPPTGGVAVVEYVAPSDARRAFKGLAYSRFHHVPIYLQWAPIDILLPAGEKPIVDNSSVLSAINVEEDGSTLFVKNLNFATTEETLRELFEAVVPVRSVTIGRVKDGPVQSRSLGYAFVEFLTKENALTAIKQLQGKELDGHVLKLSFATGTTTRSEATAKPTTRASVPSAKLLVRNVAFEATKKDLRQVFGAFGQLKSVRLPKRIDGHTRGFAFIDFMSKQEAKNAFQKLQDTHLYGRHLVIEYSKEESGRRQEN